MVRAKDLKNSSRMCPHLESATNFDTVYHRSVHKNSQRTTRRVDEQATRELGGRGILVH